MRRDASGFVSQAVLLRARQLGAAVRAARLARNSTQEAMSERARMSPLTWLKIERGEVGVAMGSWLSAFEQTGLLSRLAELAGAQADAVGEQLRKEQLRKRARSADRPETDFDF